MSQYESYFAGHNDAHLFFQSWVCEGDDARGTVLVTHGLAEHADCYSEFAQNLNKANWNVCAWDHRGHGRSEGKRGYTADFKFLVEDHKLAVDYAEQLDFVKGKPLVLFGHSMGGLVTTLSLIEKERPEISGVILSSPAFGVALDIPKPKLFVADVAAKWLPRLTLWNEIYYHQLTRDHNKINEYESDSLRHDKISPGLFLGMTRSFDEVFEGLSQLKKPLLLQLAGQEQIVSLKKAQQAFEGWPHSQKEKLIYEDSLHEIYNDLDRSIVYKDLTRFLSQLDK